MRSSYLRHIVRHAWLLLAALPCACTSIGILPANVLDGPIDFQVDNGFAAMKVVLHVELGGSATAVVTQFQDPPRTLTGTVAADKMQMLDADIGAVDFASFKDDYNCQDFQPCGADAPLNTGTFRADGTTRQIRIDRNIPDESLPAGLVKIFNDLDGIATQLQGAQ